MLKIVSIQLEADGAGGLQGNDVNIHLFRAPAAADGGGIYIKNAFIIEEGSGQGAGTAYAVSLQNWGTAGTAVEGTIGTAGGTASPLSAATPTALTLTAAQQTIDAGEWLVLNKTETNSSDPVRASLVIEYYDGN